MSTISDTPIPSPTIAPENKPFWEAANRGELLIKHCRACDRLHWYPRGLCPWCFSADTDWVPSQGRGRIYSFSAAPGSSLIAAYIQLDEGITLLSNIVDAENRAIEIGDRVQLKFCAAENGQQVPMFRVVTVASAN